jgi:dTDP-4-amino-4,6-dideoxygalactose transaminase
MNWQTNSFLQEAIQNIKKNNFVDAKILLLKILERLNKFEINPRRYFYPSLNQVKFIQGPPMPISENIASRILCLPLFVGLDEKKMNIIIDVINNAN